MQCFLGEQTMPSSELLPSAYRPQLEFQRTIQGSPIAEGWLRTGLITWRCLIHPNNLTMEVPIGGDHQQWGRMNEFR